MNYYRTTRSGQIIFGKGGGKLLYKGGRIEQAAGDRDPINAALADFRRSHPMLADVPVSRQWSGPIDLTDDSLPLLGCLPDVPHVGFGIGWSGNGINTSRIGRKDRPVLVTWN